MKHFYRFFAWTLLLVFAVAHSQAAEPVTWKWTPVANQNPDISSSPALKSLNNVEWTISITIGKGTTIKTDYANSGWKFGNSDNSPSVVSFFTEDASAPFLKKCIESVKIQTTAPGTAAKFGVEISVDGATVVTSSDELDGQSDKAHTFVLDTKSKVPTQNFEIKFVNKNSPCKGQIAINSIEITYSDAKDPQPSTLTILDDDALISFPRNKSENFPPVYNNYDEYGDTNTPLAFSDLVYDIVPDNDTPAESFLNIDPTTGKLTAVGLGNYTVNVGFKGNDDFVAVAPMDDKAAFFYVGVTDIVRTNRGTLSVADSNNEMAMMLRETPAFPEIRDTDAGTVINFSELATECYSIDDLDNPTSNISISDDGRISATAIGGYVIYVGAKETEEYNAVAPSDACCIYVTVTANNKNPILWKDDVQTELSAVYGDIIAIPAFVDPVDIAEVVVTNVDNEVVSGLTYDAESRILTAEAIGEFFVTIVTAPNEYLEAGHAQMHINVSKAPAGIAWNPELLKLTAGEENIVAPMLVNPNNLPVKFSIINEDLEVVDGLALEIADVIEGQPVLKWKDDYDLQPQTVVLMATFDGDDHYAGAEEMVIITVEAKKLTDTFKIVFKGTDGGDANTSIGKVSTLSNVISDGIDYVKSMNGGSNVYKGMDDYGLKMANGKNDGELTIDLSDLAVGFPVRYKLYVKQYGSDKTKLSLISNYVESNTVSTGFKKDDYTWEYSADKDAYLEFEVPEEQVKKINQLVIKASANNRLYLKSIEVEYIPINHVSAAWNHGDAALENNTHEIEYNGSHVYRLNVGKHSAVLPHLSYNVAFAATTLSDEAAVEAPVAGDHYTVHSDNGGISFLRAGNYVVTLSSANPYYEVADGSALNVNITPVSVDIEGPARSDYPWNSDGVLLDKTYEITGSISDNNISISVKPAFTPEYIPAERPAFIPQSVWDELKGSSAYKYDAYYRDMFGTHISATKDGCTVTFPCSGLYDLTVSVGDDKGNVAPASKTYQLNIYPNMDGLTINDMPVVSGTSEIQYPVLANGKLLGEQSDQVSQDAEVLTKSIVATSANILDRLWFKLTPEPQPAPAPRRAPSEMPEGFTLYQEFVRPDLSVLRTGDDSYRSAEISFISTKNGAMTPLTKEGQSIYSYTIVPTTDMSNVPVGIDTVVEDIETETEYFTLSGLRVDADRLEPGIYIVRRGAETHKAVIR